MCTMPTPNRPRREQADEGTFVKSGSPKMPKHTFVGPSGAPKTAPPIGGPASAPALAPEHPAMVEARRAVPGIPQTPAHLRKRKAVSKTATVTGRKKTGKQSLRLELGGTSGGGAGLNIPQ